jgi:Fe-S-cluster containining protein
MSFPCTGCGCCCKVIDWADKIIVRDDPTHPYYFPYTHKEGVCEKLIDNKCSVYESRPLICRIEDSMPKGYNQTAYYNMNIEACHHLIDKFGLSEEWKPAFIQEDNSFTTPSELPF